MVRETVRKIFVLGDNREAISQCMVPDDRVVGFSQTEVGHMDGFVAGIAQPDPQRRRKLGINQKVHAADTSTA